MPSIVVRETAVKAVVVNVGPPGADGGGADLTAVEADITALQADVAALDAADTSEAGTRAAADTALDARLDTLEAISIATDAELAAAVAAEAALRVAADATEASDREAADDTLNSAITAEATTRGNADSALDTRVDALELAPPAHVHPTSEITGLDAALADRATDAELASEASTRASADSALDTRVDALELAPPAHVHPISDVTSLQAALDAKAPLASPALTGNPTAPTQTAGNNSTRLATTAYADAAAAARAAATHTHSASDITSGTLDVARLPTNIRDVVIPFLITNGGSVIATGVQGEIVFPTGTITKVQVLSRTSGSIVIDLWKDTYANYAPLVGDTITASAKPTLSSATKYEDATLTGWTTSVTAGDIGTINVDSATTVTSVLLLLTVRRS